MGDNKGRGNYQLKSYREFLQDVSSSDSWEDESEDSSEEEEEDSSGGTKSGDAEVAVEEEEEESIDDEEEVEVPIPPTSSRVFPLKRIKPLPNLKKPNQLVKSNGKTNLHSPRKSAGGGGGGGGTKSGRISGRKSGRRRRRKNHLTICLTRCRYEVVRQVSKKYNLREVGDEDDWNICWTDYSISLDRALEMKRFQIVNHFPAMNEICRKDLLARNLNRMKRFFNKEYDIFPKTWSLPSDLGDLQTYASGHKNKTFICKPELGCQGRGIFLLKEPRDLNPFGKIICQLYLSKPFLIDGYKFDLRIYVLITSVDPLRVYVYKEGMGRFATAKYKPPTVNNTENSFMHLTNYSVNKFSSDFVYDDEAGSKRKLTAIYKWLADRSYDIASTQAGIDDVILKTIISAHSIIKHNYRTCFPNHDLTSACFEILGFDVILDQWLKPYILEVNHSPSFHTDSLLDQEIKESLLSDTFAMLNLGRLDRNKVLRADRKRVRERLFKHHSTEPPPPPQPNNLAKNTKKEWSGSGDTAPPDESKSKGWQEAQFQHEMDNCGGYRLIYPPPRDPNGNTQDKYMKYFEQNISLYQETAASQARAICTRNQIEEHNKKAEEEKRKRGCLRRDKNPTSLESAHLPLPKPKPRTRTPILVNGHGHFNPERINENEELERIRGLMNRGILVRSLGVELQIFNLLRHNGTLKPEEEKIFRRMHLNNEPSFTSSSSQQQQQHQSQVFNHPQRRGSFRERVTPVNSEIFTIGSPPQIIKGVGPRRNPPNIPQIPQTTNIINPPNSRSFYTSNHSSTWYKQIR